MTSNDRQDNVVSLEDRDTYIDPAFDYDYMLDLYNVANANENDQREWDLVFHGLPEIDGMEIREIIAWVLEDGLGLDYSQCIENAERFGENEGRARNIRVKMSTVEQCREIICQAKKLSQHEDFRKMHLYIQPFLRNSKLENLYKDLEQNLHKFEQRKETKDAKIAFWRIVQYVDGELEVLYTPTLERNGQKSSELNIEVETTVGSKEPQQNESVVE